MLSVVETTLRGVKLGQAIVFKNMAVVPLFDGPGANFTYISMKSALAKGIVEISEVSESGSVPELKVINHGEQPVLLVDGEEVQGAKQNRIINTSILLGGKSETVIPVSCTEHGRWNYSSRAFFDSGYVMPARSRSSKSERVFNSLKFNKSFDAGQGAVWNEVAAYHQALGTSSRSGAMRDALNQKEQDFNDYLSAFPLQEGQKGMIVLINGQPSGADLLSMPEAYADLHEKLVKSFAVESLIRPTEQDSEKDDLAIEAYNFLQSLKEAEESAFEPVGLGEVLRYECPRSGGAALVYSDTVVHLNIYPKSWVRNEAPRRRAEPETAFTSLTNWIRRRH